MAQEVADQPVETTAIVKQEQPISKGGITDLVSSKQFATVCVASGLFKDTTDIAKALMKITLGRALGIDEATAMQNILILNGKMSFTSNLIATRIKQSGKYRYDVLKKDDKGCSLQFYEKIEEYTPDGKFIFRWHKPGPPETFTMDMAKRAGLTRNQTWTNWPEAMCFARCITAGARTYAPDIFAGTPIYSAEELAPERAVVSANGEVVVEEEDGGGKGGRTSPKVNKVTKTQLTKIEKLFSDTGAEQSHWWEHYGVKSVSELNSEQAEDLIRLLEARKKAM